jgi:hypothetical protein
MTFHNPSSLDSLGDDRITGVAKCGYFDGSVADALLTPAGTENGKEKHA